MSFLSFIRRDRNIALAVEQSRDRLYRIAYSWCHDHLLADDLAQEALAKAMKNASQLRDAGALDSWLFKILNNCWRDHFRRNRDMVDISEIDLACHSTPESEHARNETITKVRKAVGGLPLAQRQVLTLVDLEGFSYIEVAGILEIPIGTVMSRLCRARQSLKNALLVSDPSQEMTPRRIRRIK